MARRPDLFIINKKKKRTCRIEDFTVRTTHRVKIKGTDKRELEKTMEYESDDYTNCNWCSWYNHQRIGTWTGRLGNGRTSRDHPNYGIVKIGQNTEKSPGDIRRLTVT